MGEVTEIQQGIISYLTFRLGEEQFGLNVGKLINILEMVPITRVPKTPDYMRGIINLRGQVLPIIDTKTKLNMGDTEFTNNTCILVIETMLNGESMRLGAIVDNVLEVLEFTDEMMMEPPKIGNDANIDFITGIVHHDDKFVMIMDIDSILDRKEISEINKIARKMAK